jgi:serine/threonine-protein kinase
VAGLQLPPGEVELPDYAIATHPVTMGEYLEWIRELFSGDPAAAARRVPRHDEGLNPSGAPYWELGPEGWRIPIEDADGDAWSPAFPVFGISWHDARAYTRWRAARDAASLRLPTEHEWEKAARGVDGRIFPWGDEFDPALCCMVQSRPGRPVPDVVGSHPTDVSPYGVRDMAGLVREWCADAEFDGDPGRRPIRGGAWSGTARMCRAANRYGYEPSQVDPMVGFRLAMDVPARGG